jgi:hypothetical protein
MKEKQPNKLDTNFVQKLFTLCVDICKLEKVNSYYLQVMK